MGQKSRGVNFPIDRTKSLKQNDAIPTEGVNEMRKLQEEYDTDTRALMALARESQRMKDAAERVDLVVRAMALRHGVRVPDDRNP